MNPNIGIARLGQPRSNTTTNVLFAITFVVFAFIADVAIDQQRGEVADSSATQEAAGFVPALGLRALVRPYF